MQPNRTKIPSTKAWLPEYYENFAGFFTRCLIGTFICGCLFIGMSIPVVFAGGPLQLDMIGNLVTEELDEEGKLVEKIMDLPEKVLPGNIIEYTISAQNLKDGVLKDVDIIGRIPEGTGYLQDSANKPPQFSIDGGKTYMPAPVTYTVVEDGKEVEKIATPDMYTNIKWIVEILHPSALPVFTYRVAVK